MESLELEQEVANLEEEKENLLSALQEAHTQNLQWEKKVHLAKELKDSLKKEMEGSTSALKLAIHHMTVTKWVYSIHFVKVGDFSVLSM